MRYEKPIHRRVAESAEKTRRPLRLGGEKLKLRPESDRTVLELLARQTRLLLSNCGGRGRCGKCRVQILGGRVNAVTESEPALLGPEEIGANVRLACHCIPLGPIAVAVPAWAIMNPVRSSAALKPQINADEHRLAPIGMRRRFLHSDRMTGIAIDVGTTNVAVEAWDVKQRRRVRETTFLNPQIGFGLDVITRIGHSRELLADDGLGRALRQLIKEWEGGLRIADCEMRIVAAGNTTMCHFLLGRDATTLGFYPYASQLPLGQFVTGKLGQRGRSPRKNVTVPAEERDSPPGAITVLPMVGSFIGADTLAAIVASGMNRRAELTLLADLGTNGEIVLGNRDRLLACSTAAGPALEGANLSCGVLARPGAITDVFLERDRICYQTKGRRRPVGLCGSAIIKLLSELRKQGLVQANGRLSRGPEFTVVPAEKSGTGRAIVISQSDIRELQLAKGAIAAGIRILLKEWPARAQAVKTIFLTGLLGAKLNRDAAERIGQLPTSDAQLVQSPNLALAGARIALLDPARRPEFETLARLVKEVLLNQHPEFTDYFVRSMELKPWR